MQDKTKFQLFLEANGLKKVQLAQFLNVSKPFITQLCKGERDLPNEKLALLIKQTQWDTTSLLSEAPLVPSSPVPSPSTARADTSVSPVSSSQLAILQAENARLKAENEWLRSAFQSQQKDKENLQKDKDLLRAELTKARDELAQARERLESLTSAPLDAPKKDQPDLPILNFGNSSLGQTNSSVSGVK